MDNNQEELNSSQKKNLIQEFLTCIKNKEYFKALKIFFKMLEKIYGNYIKGKAIIIKNKKIPLSVVLSVLFIICLAFFGPSSHQKVEEPQQDILKEQQVDANSYNKDNVRVYGLYKCENAVCGLIENTNDVDIARILISITFHDKNGAVVYEGGAEANGVTSMSRIKFKISADGKFEYFHLTDVTVERH